MSRVSVSFAGEVVSTHPAGLGRKPRLRVRVEPARDSLIVVLPSGVITVSAGDRIKASGYLTWQPWDSGRGQHVHVIADQIEVTS